eukprot:jgi/Tetstr1/433318/TSEL_022605.t1
MLLSADDDKTRDHYKMIIEHHTSRRSALEAQLDDFVLKAEEVAAASAKDDDSDSEDEGFGKDAKGASEAS